MFRGRYTHTVDGKGRVAIPAKFRLQLDEGAVLANWMDGCAAIFTRDSFEEFAAKLAALPLADDNARKALALHLLQRLRSRDRRPRTSRPAGIDPRVGRPRERGAGGRPAGPRRGLESGALGGVPAAGGLTPGPGCPDVRAGHLT